MTLTPYDPQFEQIARFQSLQPGQYWKAVESVPEEGIEAGTVLLIRSIRWVDEVPHTIILRPHPSMIGKRVELEVPQSDGTVHSKRFVFDEHRFLLDDFLARFEFEPDHQRIRGEEVRRVQARITELQSELLEAQSNPQLLAGVVEGKLREQAEQDRPTLQPGTGSDNRSADGASTTALVSHGEAVAMASGTVASAIGAGLTAQGVEAMRAAAGREHQIATIKSEWIQGKTTEIAETIKAMTPFYEEQAAAALAQTEDVRSYVAKLLQGIESLDLYVGKGVEVMTVRAGPSAPRDVPLTFVQRKLLMDEELAVWADVDAQFDFESEPLFFDALRNHDGLIEQIFPTERCVLVMATTRRNIDYGNAFTNIARNDENRKAFLLVRDGMNIHRVFSPVESHLGSARLFPTKDEQDRVFQGVDGEKVKFEDVAYTDKLAAHESLALHYKRFLLLVCGLDHRLKLFGDFYDGPQSFRFVSMEFQQAHCRFLHDGDDSMLLPAGERPSVAEWIAERNAYLRSGSRVLCRWRAVMNPSTAPGACKRTQSHRGYEFRYSPDQQLSVAIAYREGEAFCVDVEVCGYSYSAHADREFACKVNLSEYRDGEWEHDDLAFLCLDSVQPEDLRWYILNRRARRNHLEYIRFFKQALRHILSERESERESRDRLAQAMADGNVGMPDDRGAIIDQAVIAWRAANRGKALPRYGDVGADAAWKALLDQLFMLAGDGRRRVDDVEAFVRERGMRPLRLVLSAGAKLIVYAEPGADERDDRLEPHAWVHRITLERTKTKILEKSRRWVLLPKQAASETTVHQWDEVCREWGERSSGFASFERKAEVFARVVGTPESLQRFNRPLTGAEHAELLKAWVAVRSQANRDAKYVQNPVFAIPFGVLQHAKTLECRYLCVGTMQPQVLLYQLAPDEEARRSVVTAYVKPFQKKDTALSGFKQSQGHFQWRLMEASMSLADRHGLFLHEKTGVSTDELSGFERTAPLLADWFAQWRKQSAKSARSWVDGEVMEDGRITLDSLLGNKLPDDFEPLRIYEISLNTPEGGPAPAHARWFDICAERDEVRAGRSWTNGSHDEIERLLAGTGHDARAGYSCQTHLQESREHARKLIASQVNSRDGGAFRATLWDSVDGAPAPPPGVERWIVVEAAR